jgi:hypothetical protein
MVFHGKAFPGLRAQPGGELDTLLIAVFFHVSGTAGGGRENMEAL